MNNNDAVSRSITNQARPAATNIEQMFSRIELQLAADQFMTVLLSFIQKIAVALIKRA